MQSRPANFANRFRIAARKSIYFSKKIAKLGPIYFNCNDKQTSCTRKKASPRTGCQDCEYTIQRKYFFDELEKELRTVARGTWLGSKKWPAKFLVDLASEVASLAFTRKDGYDRKWTVVTTMLVNIYRDEQSKAKAIESYNLNQPSGETK